MPKIPNSRSAYDSNDRDSLSELYRKMKDANVPYEVAKRVAEVTCEYGQAAEFLILKGFRGTDTLDNFLKDNNLLKDSNEATMNAILEFMDR